MSMTSRVSALNLNDPYTFVVEEPITTDDGIAATAGDIITKWFSTAEQGREFRIIAMHQMNGCIAYETRFVGFQQIEVRQAQEPIGYE